MHIRHIWESDHVYVWHKCAQCAFHVTVLNTTTTNRWIRWMQNIHVTKLPVVITVPFCLHQQYISRWPGRWRGSSFHRTGPGSLDKADAMLLSSSSLSLANVPIDTNTAPCPWDKPWSRKLANADGKGLASSASIGPTNCKQWPQILYLGEVSMLILHRGECTCAEPHALQKLSVANCQARTKIVKSGWGLFSETHTARKLKLQFELQLQQHCVWIECGAIPSNSVTVWPETLKCHPLTAACAQSTMYSKSLLHGNFI